MGNSLYSLDSAQIQDPHGEALQQAPIAYGEGRRGNPVDTKDPNITVERENLIRSTVNTLRRIYSFRRQYDARRSFFYRQYIGQRDTRLYPDNITPRSNTFVPYPFTTVEAVVTRTMDALFSSPDWFDCRGEGINDEPAAERMKLVIRYLLEKSGFIDAMELLTRNICIYGHGGIKVDWNWDYDTVTYPEPIYAQQPAMQPALDEAGQPQIDPNTGQPLGLSQFDQNGQPAIDPNTGQPIVLGYRPATKQILKQQPRFIPIDTYDLLVDPDEGLVAHLVNKPFGELKREAEAYKQLHGSGDPGDVLYYDEAVAELEEKIKNAVGWTDQSALPDTVVIRLAELWNEIDNTVTVITFGEDADSIRWKDLRAQYRGTNYSAFRRKVYKGNPILMWHGPNQFMHKKNPIVFTSYIKLPNEIYGLGAIETISDLSESVNKIVNMITDNWNLGVNQRYAYNTDADIDHEALNDFNVPGGKVAVVGNPNEVLYPLPTHTPQPGDYDLLQVYRALIEATSGVSDFYAKGVGSPAGNRTATGINQVIGESSYRFRMFIRNLELDIVQPVLKMVASMVQQYVTDELEIKLSGQAPLIDKYPKVSPEQLIGEFTFKLTGVNYSINKVVLQRNLMALANIAGPSGFIDDYYGLRELAKAFEIPNLDKILKPPERVAQEQQAAEQKQIQLAKLEFDRQVMLMYFEALFNGHTKAQIAAAKVEADRQHAKEGRPATTQFEGKIPGATFTSIAREFAHATGASGLGLEGLGEENLGYGGET